MLPVHEQPMIVEKKQTCEMDLFQASMTVENVGIQISGMPGLV